MGEQFYEYTSCNAPSAPRLYPERENPHDVNQRRIEELRNKNYNKRISRINRFIKSVFK
jgi:hypothetical protein